MKYTKEHERKRISDSDWNLIYVVIALLAIYLVLGIIYFLERI
jgi:hypothetical protein